MSRDWHDCLLLSRSYFPDTSRYRFYPGGDFNCDGDFSISDVWEFLAWAMHMPGDAIISSVFTASDLEFFEVERTVYNTYASAAIFFVLAFLLFAVLSDDR